MFFMVMDYNGDITRSNNTFMRNGLYEKEREDARRN